MVPPHSHGGVVTSVVGRKKFGGEQRKKVSRERQIAANSTTMPSATTTKSAMAGTKRKSAPVKEVYVKGSKKAKIESAPKMNSKSKKPEKSAKVAPVKKQESSDSDEDDLDSDADGGVPLGTSASDVEDDDDEMPNAADGLHPDRVKAVAANSNALPVQHYATY